MNWFTKKQFKKASLDWKEQEGEYIIMGDVNRYVMDSYAIKIYVSKTVQGWTVSLMTNHAYLGTAQYCVFWKFGENQEKTAREVYSSINEIVRKTCREFVIGEKPTSLFDPTLRSRVQKVNNADLVRTNIPHINYSYDIDYSANWDKNIYGPRYPEYKEKSFDQYLNSSIYSNDKNAPIGKFAL